MNDIPLSPATTYPAPPPVPHEVHFDPRKVGMIAFFVSEAAFFSTLIMAYLIFLHESRVGPTPREALALPLALANTLCLLASSFTIHLAEKKLHAENRKSFLAWWGLTILLGTLFLLGTAYEWNDLIRVHHLTMGRNLFGTTYYTLVGFHAAHVTAGVVMLALMFFLVRAGRLSGPKSVGIELVSWYWHFVDVVWVVVFLIVYVAGR